VAKVKMICPFSGKQCRECAVYRGRHYYLCFRGKSEEEVGDLVKPLVNPAILFKEPVVLPEHIYDPFAHPMKGSVYPEDAFARSLHPVKEREPAPLSAQWSALGSF